MPHFAVSGVCLMQRKLIKLPGEEDEPTVCVYGATLL